MFSISFEENQIINSKATFLKEMLIFKISKQNRRASDIKENDLEAFINSAFKAILIYDETKLKIKKTKKKKEKILCLENSRKELEKIHNKFDLLYSKQKIENPDSYRNKYVVFSHNIILSSELLLATKELELLKI